MGGYVGGRVAGIIPEHFIRWVVIVAGSIMTVVYAQRYWRIG